MLIILTAWRLLFARRYLVALVSSSLAILVLVVGGFQSLWYALATAALFAAALAVQRAGAKRNRPVGRFQY